MACPSLQTIDLSGCPALSSLLLVAGEHLKQLDLSDCKVQQCPVLAVKHHLRRMLSIHMNQTEVLNPFRR